MLLAVVGTYALAAALFIDITYNQNCKIMKLKIKNPFKTLSDNCEKNRRENAIAHVNRVIQLREFEGKIWLCYDNIPIVEQEQLKDTLCNTVAKTREAVCRYYKL